MNSFFRSRCCRCCVCLLLVLVLLISWSPIRAKAVGTEQYVAVVIDKVGFYAQAGAVSTGAAVFGYVLAGIGLVVSTARLIEIMNDYMEWSGELETSIYYYPDGSWSYGVDVGFIDRVRAFAFERGYVLDASQMATTVPEGVAFGTYTPIVPCVAYQYSYHVVISGKYRVFSNAYLISCIPNNRYVVSRTSPCTNYVTDGIANYYYQSAGYGERNLTAAEFEKFLGTASTYHHLGEFKSTADATIQKIWDKYGWTGIAGNGDVSIGYVAPPAVPMIEAYPEWHTNARPATNPDTDEEITVLPIPLNPSVDPETQIGTLTQPDIWQGSIADPMPDTGTDTDDPDSGSNDPTTPTTGTDNPDSPGDDGSQDVPLTPDQLQPYVFDLRDFFPFCIPFDLFDFFQLLDADPVAPVFHWEIQDLAGTVYSIDIDLSAWDSTALFFRRLQLLVFTVGLAMASRKFIKW